MSSNECLRVFGRWTFTSTFGVSTQFGHFSLVNGVGNSEGVQDSKHRPSMIDPSAIHDIGFILINCVFAVLEDHEYRRCEIREQGLLNNDINANTLCQTTRQYQFVVDRYIDRHRGVRRAARPQCCFGTDPYGHPWRIRYNSPSAPSPSAPSPSPALWQCHCPSYNVPCRGWQDLSSRSLEEKYVQ